MVMTRVALAIILTVFATAAQAQGFYTLKQGKEAWWLRASFNPMHTEVRGIPVRSIRPNWCKATEYTRALMPKKEMEEEGSGKLMDEVGLSFSVTGNFDRSKTRQVALVGVYESCAGQKGAFLLVIDEATQKVRFVDATPSKTQFAVLAPDKKDIVILYCMECDVGGTLRWNAKKKAFAWLKSRGH
ncbi:MAG: hypothetical protein QOH67_4187 [Hyphomicrobiales bacterium]|jgi:hypothetical protein|nr:hypothetical protein [Hyphomicrobiales bacterium]